MNKIQIPYFTRDISKVVNGLPLISAEEEYKTIEKLRIRLQNMIDNIIVDVNANRISEYFSDDIKYSNNNFAYIDLGMAYPYSKERLVEAINTITSIINNRFEKNIEPEMVEVLTKFKSMLIDITPNYPKITSYRRKYKNHIDNTSTLTSVQQREYLKEVVADLKEIIEYELTPVILMHREKELKKEYIEKIIYSSDYIY